MKLPYIKWYFRDAAADLRLLDAEPRCVWYEMLWIMAASDRYGYLERQGRPMTDEEISRTSGLPIKVIFEARPILLADGLPSVEAETGIWFNRRMVADARKREACSEAGKKGGGSPLLASSPLATEAMAEPRTQNPYKAKGALNRSPLKVKRFVPPTVEEVTEHCREKGYTFSPADFVAYYEVRGWIPNGSKSQMKSWPAACRTWQGWQDKRQKEAATSSNLDQSRIARGRTAADYAAVIIRGDGK